MEISVVYIRYAVFFYFYLFDYYLSICSTDVLLLLCSILFTDILYAIIILTIRVFLIYLLLYIYRYVNNLF
jgi:hypothetical protein